jgi:hypothetical protein
MKKNEFSKSLFSLHLARVDAKNIRRAKIARDVAKKQINTKRNK